MDWALDKERAEDGAGKQGEQENNDGGQEKNYIFKPRASAGFNTPKNRPLYVKMELLLDLIFRWVSWWCVRGGGRGSVGMAVRPHPPQIPPFCSGLVACPSPFSH